MRFPAAQRTEPPAAATELCARRSRLRRGSDSAWSLGAAHRAPAGHAATAHGSGLGRWRWVVERTFAWLNQFRRLRVRYDKRADIHIFADAVLLAEGLDPNDPALDNRLRRGVHEFVAARFERWASRGPPDQPPDPSVESDDDR